MRRLLTLALLALALAPGHAQTQTHAQTAATHRIAGTVVSAVDKHPLQRASIQITNTGDPQQVETTTSDEYGRFAFSKVPAGMFELQGSATSYLPTLHDEHDGGFNTGIVTGAGVDTESLTLKLVPESAITGTVVNEAAEPVEGATVRLYLQSHTFGDGRIMLASAAATDDRGRFELPRLKPGTYFVAVTGSPWYAVHPPDPEPAGIVTLPIEYRATLQRQQQPAASSFTDSIDPTLDVAYSTEFYPGTADSAHAAPIVIRGGDSPELHFQLAPQPAVSVTIPRSPPKPGQRDVPPQLRMSIFGQLEPAAQGEMRQSPTQTVITGLAPGDYILSDPRNPGNQAGGMPLHLAERVTQATPEAAAASGLAHVHVIARPADRSSSPSHLSVSLIRPHTTDMVSNEANDKGHVDLDAPPGDYYFQIEGGGKVLFPRQILSGDKPLADGNIHLAANSSRFFTITFAEGTHTLKGFARKDGKGFPGAFILLFPTSETSDVHTFFRQQSDLDGSFSITGVAPGAYTLLAIDGGWDLDWQHDKALDHYLPAAQKIRAPDTAEKTHYLTEFVAVQPR
jgi:hypothetical protein